MPELLQNDCTTDRLKAQLIMLLADEGARHAQIEIFGKALSTIGLGDALPSHRATEKSLALIAFYGR
jgi:hypothetical protein